MRLLWRFVPVVELLSLLVLLTNLATGHDPRVAAATGPLHGFAYLTTIVLALITENAGARARWLALVPGVGGFLSARAIEANRAEIGRNPAPQS
jgi:hypothetical protein